MQTPKAILFDLDGTLADTAPDLAAAVNVMRVRRNLPPAPYEQLRPYASAGARGLIGAGFNVAPTDPIYEAMRVEFLDQYASAIADQSCLFEEVPGLLSGIDQLLLPWGIITNKAMRFTDALVPLLDLKQARCIISGDTTPHAKPHPAPLYEAARQLGIDAAHCWYVGDDLRDIQAAKAAGMHSIAAAWGYCGATEPAHWEADLILHSPLELLDIVRAKHLKTSSS
ncbi:HAD family hydrolase [Undibacterium sp. SXout20W]|uniref:HAD family hydrolase n=1 Tax=Undibacterium sp. SXout20W TaxID=3413051 RepID=UPI003BEF4E93